jgi:hypothetical protein
MEGKFGFSKSTWEAAKKQAKEALIDRARVRGMMPYSELIQKIKAIPF